MATTGQVFVPCAEAHVLDLPGQRGPGWAYWKEAGKGLDKEKRGKHQDQDGVGCRSSPPSSLIPFSGHPGLAPGCAQEKDRN